MFYGFHPFGWLAVFLAILLIAAVFSSVFLRPRFWRQGPRMRRCRRREAYRQDRRENAVELLNRRYAKGEISKEEYERIREDLRT